MYLIGLTGGIASGKSTVARRLAELGAVHIDADQLARVAVEPGTAALDQIGRSFGPSVIASDGSLDRAALGAVVFADPAALALLNSIVHPAVRSLSNRMIHEASESDPHAVVVYDVPLLVEAAVDHPFDLIVVTHTDEAARVRRMVDLRGMPEAEAVRRIRSQASDAERLAVADVVIDTTGTLGHTLAQVDDLWHRVRAAAETTVSGAP
ncbi:dephospho-CoA kinase [Cryobacterium sp. MP_M5]|uniref:dephospho-CoA kinase n=1 Tax=unclassified Cryobacterium TaxID=2649013 RepID=UPI0018CA408A|nr:MULTISPECIES: dephospho-CoA kinase [unclassified Cryobacterium]MBG6058697.1 dephospho-CoA kinase [Cryobacterium sp. MP_M3]MEC5176824.1 dephospho-CoA kinase [Cryobacterium sp. MP_M5]